MREGKFCVFFLYNIRTYYRGFMMIMKTDKGKGNLVLFIFRQLFYVQAISKACLYCFVYTKYIFLSRPAPDAFGLINTRSWVSPLRGPSRLLGSQQASTNAFLFYKFFILFSSLYLSLSLSLCLSVCLSLRLSFL